MDTRIFSTLVLFLASVFFVGEAIGELVDTEGHAVTNQTALGDIDMAKGTMGDLKAAINEGYATTNDVHLTPVYSQTPTFSKWTIVRDGEDVTSQVQQPKYTQYDEGEYYWQVYVVDGDDPGVDQYDEPLDINILSWSDADDTHHYIATRVRTDVVGYTLGSQTDKALAPTNAIPKKTSQLTNDGADGTHSFASTQQVAAAVNTLSYDISINTNFVRRTDSNFSLGTSNFLQPFSVAIGNRNTIGQYSQAMGYDNTLNQNTALQYAFGCGNRSEAFGNFIMGAGSGADEHGQISLSLGTMAVATNAGSFVWNYYPTDYSSVQADEIFDLFPKYYSHGEGSFNVNPIGGLKGFWIGETNFEQHVLATVADPIAEAGEIVIDNLKQFVTNSTIVGYTDWRYTGNTSPSAVYSITMADAGAGNYAFTLNDTIAVTALGTVTTNTLNPTVLVYTTAGITASRDPIRRNNNGFAYNSDVQQLRVEMTNEVQTLRKDVEDMDTSYFHYNQITNVNQSVQYIVPASGQTTLEIKIPESGTTKDWVIYVNTNDQQPLSLVLPPANYWVASEEVTNDIVTATALYFSQINADTFSLGRKEMIPVTVSSSRVTTFSVSPSAKKSAAARRLSGLRSKVDAKK